MPQPKESIMRRLLTYFGIGCKKPSVKELAARADAIVAKRKAKKSETREAVPAGA